MDLNSKAEQAKNDLNEVKKDPKKLFNLAWYYPLVAGLLLWFSSDFLQHNAKSFWLWFTLVAVLALGVWTIVANSNGKDNPLKLGWTYFMIPVASIVFVVAAPQLIGWLVGILITWGGIVALIKYELLQKAWAKIKGGKEE